MTPLIFLAETRNAETPNKFNFYLKSSKSMKYNIAKRSAPTMPRLGKVHYVSKYCSFGPQKAPKACINTLFWCFYPYFPRMLVVRKINTPISFWRYFVAKWSHKARKTRMESTQYVPQWHAKCILIAYYILQWAKINIAKGDGILLRWTMEYYCEVPRFTANDIANYYIIRWNKRKSGVFTVGGAKTLKIKCGFC